MKQIEYEWRVNMLIAAMMMIWSYIYQKELSKEYA